MASMTRTRTASKSAGRRGGKPVLTGILIGLLLGIVLAIAVAVYLSRAPSPFSSKSRSAPAGKPEGAPAQVPALLPEPAAASAKGDDKPQFDFYNILQKGEAPASNHPLKPAKELAPEAGKGHFLVQAGAFQAPGDADNLKAKLALLGYEANIESANVPDKGTWYRVRLGPYGHSEEANQVRAALSHSGIAATLVKIQATSNN